jgi:putative methylase
MKQVSLEIALSKLRDIGERKINLEQYSTPSTVAASILYRALNEGSIQGRAVADFGCGNGVFAIGAALLGARKVYAIDKDESMIRVAKENSRGVGTQLEFYECDVSEFNVQVDTVIMNPPFGSQRRNADIPFIEKALELSKDFYILLNYKAGDFLRKFIDGRGEVAWEEKMKFPLNHSYDFHRKEVKMLEVRVAKVKVW